MLDRELIRNHPDEVKAAIARKGIDAPIDEFLRVDHAWREKRQELEKLQAEMNRISKSIGAFMAAKNLAEAEDAKAAAAVLKADIPKLEEEARALEGHLKDFELAMPNLPHSSVPDGKDESENVVVREWGAKREAGQPFKPHWEIAEELALFDLARGAKIAGSGFPLYTGQGAKLQRALGAFMVDHQTQANGYQEIYPPVLVHTDSLIGTGNLPKFAEDLYKTTDDLWLIPTAEVPVTNVFRDEILDAAHLPTRFAALSSCFRREAGAAGKDTRGLLRIHQFDKVEMVWFTTPERSYQDLETLTNHAESVLQLLGLPYRVIELCAGDLGAKGSKCYDVEVWAPGVDRYLEISSCSNFEAYQSRRAGVRYRPEPGAKPEFVHILNGSGLATPRLFAALLETGYQADGTVLLPKALHPYFGAEKLTKPSP